MEQNVYQKAIEQLVLEGYTILQIIQPNGVTLYLNIYKWQESYFNTAQSVDFNTAEGVNITEFLSKNVMLCNNRTEFLNHFNKEMESSILVRCEFSRDSIWYKWSAPEGIKRIRNDA